LCVVHDFVLNVCIFCM